MSEIVRPVQDRASAWPWRRRPLAMRALQAIGPVTVIGGIVWGVLQPYRIVFLAGDAPSAYDWVVQPPLLVIVVGLVFARAVVPGLVEDLERQQEGDDAAG